MKYIAKCLQKSFRSKSIFQFAYLYLSKLVRKQLGKQANWKNFATKKEESKQVDCENACCKVSNKSSKEIGRMHLPKEVISQSHQW